MPQDKQIGIPFIFCLLEHPEMFEQKPVT